MEDIFGIPASYKQFVVQHCLQIFEPYRGTNGNSERNGYPETIWGD
jgi:hypothetical protein